MTARAQGDAQNRFPRRLMIVDDEVDFALSIADVLEARGYEVELAHTVDECLGKIARFEPQMVLTDIRLGRTSGIGLLGEIGKRHPDTVCVVMTASGHLSGAPQPHLRPVLQHQGRRPRHGPGHLPKDRRRPRGRDPARAPRGARRGRLLLPPDRIVNQL